MTALETTASNIEATVLNELRHHSHSEKLEILEQVISDLVIHEHKLKTGEEVARG